MTNLLSNPDIQSQLWALFGLFASVVVGKVVAYVRGQLSAGQADDLSTMERWAEKAAAWAMVHFPGLSAADLVGKGMDELRPILSNVGLKPDDQQWAHLREVVGEFVTKQLLARQHASSVATAVGVAASGSSVVIGVK